jgi:hypothetical protein
MTFYLYNQWPLPLTDKNLPRLETVFGECRASGKFNVLYIG